MIYIATCSTVMKYPFPFLDCGFDAVANIDYLLTIMEGENFSDRAIQFRSYSDDEPYDFQAYLV